MASEGKSKKALEKSMKELKIGVTSKGGEGNMYGTKDGSSLDAMSCISSGDATSSIRGSEVDQEALMAEQFMYYPLNGVYGYYYPGFDGSMGDWNDYGYYVGTDGLDVQLSTTQSENESPAYYFPGFQAGYTPYSPVSPVVGVDGQYFTQHLYQPSPIFHQPLISSGFIPQSVAYGPELVPAYIWDSPPVLTVGHHGNAYVRDPTTPYPKSNYPSQNHAIIPSKASVPPMKQGAAAALDATQNSALPNQALKSIKKVNNEVSKDFIQTNKFNSYPSPGKNGLLVPSMNGNAKTTGKAWTGAERQISTNQAQVAGYFDMPNEQNRGPRTIGNQGAWVSDYDSTPGSVVNNSNSNLVVSIKKEDYNLPDFPTKYDHAFFFVIKSYSEDDIHKSIKYNVWASTPNGNKRLDNAYQVAQAKATEKGCKCPVFLFFSVNASGQFCGVAEMIGQVDFNKNMDFWQQDKWNGYFPVKWHIIKDIPNPQFRHIILENNDNKPVTNSRDTQEVKFPQGTEMLNIFKEFCVETSILDDFGFYESRQKAMQDKKIKPTITVMALAEEGLSDLPSQYIQPPELRPNRHCRAERAAIPVLDLDTSMNPIPHLRRICSEWGAFHVVNHGVPSRLLEKMKESGLGFFRSPAEGKLRYACDPGSVATEGYGSRMLSKEEGVLDWRDYFDHHTLPESRRNPSRWPDFPENYRDLVLEYSDSMKVLAQRLLSMISESLNLPHSYIEDAIGEVYQNITISYYSPCPQPELALGLQSHSDMGAITLLIQDDVGGLEVLKDGQWVLAKPLSDAIIVILADQTEILTNGIYRSAVHRAIVNADQARISIATFYDPAKTQKISPALQLVTEQSPLKYSEVLYGDYVSSWYSKGPQGKRNIDALLIQQ